MSTWLTEKEFRQSGAASAGVTINVAFLKEIKEDFGFRSLLNEVYYRLKPVDQDTPSVNGHEAAVHLAELRDELETYFALEEFYGYFSQAAVSNPLVDQAAIKLKSEHERLYLDLCELVEMSEQIAYHENGPEITLKLIGDCFEVFCKELADHEQAEMELMMRLCNEEIGVGD